VFTVGSRFRALGRWCGFMGCRSFRALRLRLRGLRARLLNGRSRLLARLFHIALWLLGARCRPVYRWPVEYLRARSLGALRNWRRVDSP
jgi:hypothetical protein